MQLKLRVLPEKLGPAKQPGYSYNTYSSASGIGNGQ